MVIHIFSTLLQYNHYYRIINENEDKLKYDDKKKPLKNLASSLEKQKLFQMNADTHN